MKMLILEYSYRVIYIIMHIISFEAGGLEWPFNVPFRTAFLWFYEVLAENK